VALAISSAAIAQSNNSGSIFGKTNEAGDSVIVSNLDTGAVRTGKIGSDGRFQITSLPIGNYKVELKKGAAVVDTIPGVLVAVGAGSEVTFGLEEVLVTGNKPLIDVSSTDTRTVFTATDLSKLTVKSSIEEVALLAPGAVRGDGRYKSNRGTSATSFGGSGANENAFYINGYAVTDPIKGLGSSSLPFNSIAQYQLLTGGYGSEFGRSTGGVVNIVTKSGTNDWVAGVGIDYTPSSLAARTPDSHYPQNGNPATDGAMAAQYSKGTTDSKLYSGYVGGPIIKDKLFFFLGGELEKRTEEGPTPLDGRGNGRRDGPNGWREGDFTVPRYLGKLDWNIADGHRLELTTISDVTKQDRQSYAYYYPQGTGNKPAGLPYFTKGDPGSGYDFKDGGKLFVGKYTGAITDNLIVTALYGQQTNNHTILPKGYDPNVITVRDERTDATNPLYIGGFTEIQDPYAYDKTKGYRLDVEWIVGKHDLRAGYDVQNLQDKDGTTTPGPTGYYWFYQTTSATLADGVTIDPNAPIPGAGGAAGPGGNGDFVTKERTNNGGKFDTDQYAYFIEDKWQITSNVLLSLGLRNENFKNYNSQKQVFLDQTQQWAPRLGVTWDVNGDSSLRVFGNAGRYHLAIPLNLAFRQVGGSLNTSEYFKYTGIDPTTGIPQGVVALSSGGPYSPNGEYGGTPAASSVAAKGLKAYYQDELAFGFEKKISPRLKGGARYIYRALKSQIDDNCDPRPIYNWAVANGQGSGVDLVDGYGGGTHPNGLDDRAEQFMLQYGCKIINPGIGNTIQVNDPDTGKVILANITAAQFGLPKLKRVYQGLDLFIEKTLADRWYAKLEYTLSNSKGNAEGMLDSISGQQDVAVTANWDHPEIMEGTNGYLPNDRTHQIKFQAFFEATEEWRISGGVNAYSGRPRAPVGYPPANGLITPVASPGVTGVYCPSYDVNDVCNAPLATRNADNFFQDYGAYQGPYYHVVGGVQVPPGSKGRFPWTVLVDLGTTYSPRAMGGSLKFGLDVFNALGQKTPQSAVEIAEGPAGNSYNKVISYVAPRTVRLSVHYDFSSAQK
jgi:outer membrane receptor protein involved in Fe transport